MKGHIACTDAEIRQDYQNGKFLRQICKERGAGIHRVRKVCLPGAGGERQSRRAQQENSRQGVR